MDEEGCEDSTRAIGAFPFDVEEEVMACVERLRSARGEKTRKYRSGCRIGKFEKKCTYDDAKRDWGFAHIRCDPMVKAEAMREMPEFKSPLGVHS